jgi:hypothetical protein
MWNLGLLGASLSFYSDFDLISTTTLDSGQPSVTFSNLGDYSSTYKHLQIRSSALVNASANLAIVRFNNDSGANYSRHYMEGNGSSIVSSGGANSDNMYYAYWSSGSTVISNVTVMNILDAYSTTKNKTVRALVGAVTTSNLITLYSGDWRNTGAITSVTISSPSNFLAGSRFSIYGMKG